MYSVMGHDGPAGEGPSYEIVHAARMRKGLSMLQSEEIWLSCGARKLSGGMVWLLEEHRMCSQHAEVDRRTFLVDARGPLTAMNDLPGREADGVEILGTTELAGEDSRRRALRGDEVNIIRANHDDDGRAVLAVERIREFAEFRVDHAVGDLSRN